MSRTACSAVTAAVGATAASSKLRSLGMCVTVADLTPLTLGRVAQLTQKTNQFNVTTYRYTEEQVTRFAARPGAFVRTARVTDRYGDSGLVGLVMAVVEGPEAVVGVRQIMGATNPLEAVPGAFQFDPTLARGGFDAEVILDGLQVLRIVIVQLLRNARVLEMECLCSH